jgi:hypothetical protein
MLFTLVRANFEIQECVFFTTGHACIHIEYAFNVLIYTCIQVTYNYYLSHCGIRSPEETIGVAAFIVAYEEGLV